MLSTATRARCVIVSVPLSTGLRREDLVMLDVTRVSPRDPARLREAKRARLTAVVGEGGTTRTVFLSADARTALADYLEHERPQDGLPLI
jgi:site-specific recombinase XerD